MKNRLKRIGWQIHHLCLRLAGDALVWLLVRSAKVYGWRELAEVRRVAQREVWAIAESITGHFEYQTTERQILTERLTRRFDVGMAMNEATNRARERRRVLEAEGLVVEAEPQLTDRQKAALAFQEQYLKRVQAQP
jgi:hypothetical protein